MIKKTFLTLIALSSFTSVGLIGTDNEHIVRAFQLTWMKGNTTANINDWQDFDTRVIEAGEPQPWPLHPHYNQHPLQPELQDILTRSQSSGFLIIQNGKLLSEQYFGDYSENSLTNSFSMAKSITTFLVGAAIEDGTFSSFDDYVWQYIPELKDKAANVTLAHLSNMSSGVDWDENYYSPFSPTPKLLYGYDVEQYALSRDYLGEAGQEFYYASVSTQLLSIALTRALQQQNPDNTLSQYLSEKFWKPMGMNADGLWHLDANHNELTFCCINTNLRNFAKFGLLLSQNGKWADQQLLSESFVEKIIQPAKIHYYGHSIWIDERENPQFYLLRGHLGQYVIVIPEYDLIVVRLGEVRDQEADNITHFIPKEVPFYADQAIKFIQDNNLALAEEND